MFEESTEMDRLRQQVEVPTQQLHQQGQQLLHRDQENQQVQQRLHQAEGELQRAHEAVQTHKVHEQDLDRQLRRTMEELGQYKQREMVPFMDRQAEVRRREHVDVRHAPSLHQPLSTTQVITRPCTSLTSAAIANSGSIKTYKNFKKTCAYGKLLLRRP